MQCTDSVQCDIVTYRTQLWAAAAAAVTAAAVTAAAVTAAAAATAHHLLLCYR